MSIPRNLDKTLHLCNTSLQPTRLGPLDVSYLVYLEFKVEMEHSGTGKRTGTVPVYGPASLSCKF